MTRAPRPALGLTRWSGLIRYGLSYDLKPSILDTRDAEPTRDGTLPTSDSRVLEASVLKVVISNNVECFSRFAFGHEVTSRRHRQSS